MTTDVERDAFGPPKPTLGPDEEPDAAFIERKILHQLYRLDKWKSTHLSGRDLRSGALHDTPWREIQGVLDQLVRDDVLIAHGKRPDEEYSLDPARAAYIYATLGIERQHGADGPPPGDSFEEDGGTDPRPTQRDAPWVDQGTFENTIRNLRDELHTLRLQLKGDSNGHGPGLEQKLASHGRRLTDVEGETRGNDSRLTKLEDRVREIGTHLDGLQPTDGETPRERHAKHTSSEGEDAPKDPAGYDPLLSVVHAGGLAAALASLQPPEALEQARELADRIWEATGRPPPVAPFDGLGEPGACIKEACEDDPAGFALAFDIHGTPEGPQPVAKLAPACEDHATNPPIVVRIKADLDRTNAKATVHAFQRLRDDLDLPATRRLTSDHVHVMGSDEARRRWDLAARRVARAG